MKKIKLLPKNLINQIAAGEVIERPASVVKELVENSIDAGAGRIEIEISNSCRNIRVADNGCGIEKNDVALAFSRHATSKIDEQKDLWSISTLGFRGEALASIISVSKVSCMTKTPDSETGIKVECENSEINISEAGCANGTTMEVRDLFYNIPARMKFLRKNQTELAAISEAVQNIALANPGIAFNLINNKNSILKTTGSNDIATTIGEIYSKNIINEFSKVYKEDAQFNLKITGYVSNPDFVRSNKKAIHTFINGRPVKCPILSKSIDTAYKDMIPSGKYPYIILNISIPPESLDINVHPAKREVKYLNTNLVFNFTYSAIKSALDNTTSSIPQAQEPEGNLKFYDFNRPAQTPPAETSKIPDFAVLSKYAEKTNEYSEIEETHVREITAASPRQNKLQFADTKDMPAEKPGIIGQLDNTYILIQAKEGLQIVDQHIAHERYLYEKLKEEQSYASQLLFASEPLKLEQEQVALLQENAALLSKYGYEFEFEQIPDNPGMPGNNTTYVQSPIRDKTDLNHTLAVKFRKVPNMVSQKDPKKLIEDIIQAIESSAETIEDELLIRTACRAAVKAGEKLSLWQMEELIINWQKTRYSKTCPHGRKISHTIPQKEIAGYFGRIQPSS